MKKNIAIILLFVLGLEIFIFNYSSIKSLFYKEIYINKEDLILNGIVYDETNDQELPVY